MYELLPEMWRIEELHDSSCRSSRPRRGLITDISLWTECYASLVAILTTKFPEKALQFMCYLRTIVRASRNFEGTAWVSYDAAYRRQAANRKSLDWAAIDPTTKLLRAEPNYSCAAATASQIPTRQEGRTDVCVKVEKLP